MCVSSTQPFIENFVLDRSGVFKLLHLEDAL